MKKSSHLLLGLLAGAAIGAGVYAFLQSDEGKAWWKKIKEKAADAREDMEDWIAAVKEEMEDKKSTE